MRILLIIAALTTFTTPAKSYEITGSVDVLNLELLCTGEMSPHFRTQEFYEQFRDRQQNQSTRFETDFEYSASIIDNYLDGFLLYVDTRKITLDRLLQVELHRSGIKFAGSLDRYTGAFEVSVEPKP